jgi:hypothetical protein
VPLARWSGLELKRELAAQGMVSESVSVTSLLRILAALLPWLLGRSDGGELSREGNGQLPEVPPFYTTQPTLVLEAAPRKDRSTLQSLYRHSQSQDFRILTAYARLSETRSAM